MNILFLDIDGVINSLPYIWDHGDDLYPIEGHLVDRLLRILEATECRVVVSSAWRIYFLPGKEGLIEFFLKFRIPVIDCTDDLTYPRFEQIQEWLDRHPAVEKFVILDDSGLGYSGGTTPLDKYLVKIDAKVGLSDENVLQAIEIINNFK